MSQSARISQLSVLVIDDEPQMLRLLTTTLESSSYRVVTASSGQEALVLAAQHRPDLVLLDLGLPDVPGQLVLKRLREWYKGPVIILTVQDALGEKVAALDNGADDYVTKPFHSGELLARMRAALRHSLGESLDSIFRNGDLEVDLGARIVRRNGVEIRLTPIEYSLLRLFVTNAGKVLTHRQLLTEVWGPKVSGDTHFLRVHIAHLRSKIERQSDGPELIITEPGVGYRLLAH